MKAYCSEVHCRQVIPPSELGYALARVVNINKPIVITPTLDLAIV
jgi:hypothetical protein